MTELVEVGDAIQIRTLFGQEKKYTITRVTKTLAISLRDSDGYEYKFKRLIGCDMAHPYQAWNRTEYKVIKLEKGE